MCGIEGGGVEVRIAVTCVERKWHRERYKWKSPFSALESERRLKSLYIPDKEAETRKN